MTDVGVPEPAVCARSRPARRGAPRRPSSDRPLDPRLLLVGVAGVATGTLEVVLLFPWWLTVVALLEVVIGAVVLSQVS